MVSSANLEQQHSSRGYRITMGVILFVFVILLVFTLLKIATRVAIFTDQLHQWIVPTLRVGLIAFCIILAGIGLLNRIGKQKDRDAVHKQKKDDTKGQ